MSNVIDTIIVIQKNRFFSKVSYRRKRAKPGKASKKCKWVLRTMGNNQRFEIGEDHHCLKKKKKKKEKKKKSLEGGTSINFFLRQLIPLCSEFACTLFKIYKGAKPDPMEV